MPFRLPARRGTMQGWYNLMKNSSTTATFCLILFAFLFPFSAFASSENDWELKSSLTAVSQDTSTKLAMNVARCRDLFSINSGEVSFVFTLKSGVSLSDKAQYSIKFAQGNSSFAIVSAYALPTSSLSGIIATFRLRNRLLSLLFHLIFVPLFVAPFGAETVLKRSLSVIVSQSF